MIGTRWKGIVVGLGIRGVWEGQISMERGLLCRSEAETIVYCQMYVMEDVESGVEVASRRFVDVGGQERV
jgi:hypothetical protein